MARYKKEDKKVEEVKQEPVVVEPVKSQAELEAEAAHRKAIQDSLDSSKKKKDVQIQTVEELELHIKKLRESIDNLVGEYNAKVRINENLGKSIQSSQMSIQLFERQFQERNQARLATLDKKMQEVQAADAELQALIAENRKLKDELSSQKAAMLREIKVSHDLVHASETALAQNNAMWQNREKDLIEQVEKLAKEREEFEAYKNSLQPEIARITSIKNENTLLLQKLEMDKITMEKMRLDAELAKERTLEIKAASQKQLEQDRLRLANQEAKLRDWEQNLKDQALELKVQLEAAQKVIRREQLQREIAANEA